MLDGLNSDMIEMAKQGISPVCAVEKRLAAHKLQTYNLAKQFGLLPENTKMEDFFKDDNEFWTKSFSPTTAAQTGAEAMMDTFGLPITC